MKNCTSPAPADNNAGNAVQNAPGSRPTTPSRARAGATKILKTALVGLGRIGWHYHLPSIQAHPGFLLSAVVDTNAERRAEAEQTHQVAAYPSLEALFAVECPDLVVIASPTHLHKEQACLAMEQGADVFLDKPMARDLPECRAIDACRQRTGKKLMVYQPHRALPEVNLLRHILELDLIGAPYLIKRASSTYRRRNDWQALKCYGGGMLNNYGAHYIDQLLYLTHARITRCTCHTHAVATLGDADDVAKILLRGDTGLTLDLDINSAAALAITPWMVFGPRGAITYQETDGAARFMVKYVVAEELPPIAMQEGLAAQGRAYCVETLPWRERSFPVTDAYQINFYDKCYEYFALGKSPFVPIAETLRVMELIDACRIDAGL